MVNLDQFAKGLDENPDFVSSGRYFDGSIQIHLGDEKIWIKVFMGRAILVTHDPPPFGFTFAIVGSLEDWKFALEGAKNRFREALSTGRLTVEGNTIEFSRVGKAVHGLTEVLRAMLQAGTLHMR